MRLSGLQKGLALLAGTYAIAVAVAIWTWPTATSAQGPGIACLVQDMNTLLNEFSDSVPVAGITPANVRNVICSIPSLASGGGGGGAGVFTTLQVTNLPTSCAGQPPGTFWNNGYVVSICH